MSVPPPKQDVRSFLRDLGMEPYAAAFEENAIDGSMLASLSGDDLKELGVASLGHRKAILAAIEGLRSEGSSPPTASAPAPSTMAASEPAAPAAPAVEAPATQAPTPPAPAGRAPPEPAAPLRVRETSNPEFIVEKVDKFKGLRMRVTRYSIVGGKLPRASLGKEDPAETVWSRLAAHELFSKIAKMPYGPEIFLRCAYSEQPTGNLMGIHVAYYGEGWIFLRNGALIFLVDGAPIQLKPATSNEDTIKGSIVGEEAMYALSLEQLRALCNAESVDIQVSGSKGKVEFQSDTRVFRQFHNQLFDENSYTDSIDMRSDSQKKADAAKAARQAAAAAASAPGEAGAVAATAPAPADEQQRVGNAWVSSLLVIAVTGALAGFLLVKMIPGEQMIGEYAWPGFLVGGLIARAMHGKTLAETEGTMSPEVDKHSKLAILVWVAVCTVMGLI